MADEYMAMTLRASTLKGYRHIINEYIKPHLGGKQIYAVTTADIQKMYNALKKNGRLKVGADGEKGLSGSTVRSVHMVLHEAMEYALREHLIVKNPAENTTIPKASGAVMNILNDEQLDRFMEAIKQEPLWHDLFYTAITTGVRRGELCGLMWTDFDSDHGTLKIKRTLTSDGAKLYVGDTKTVSGEREILLPSSTVELLKKRKTESRSKWIFPNFIKTEEPISPALAYSTLKRILKKAGLPSIRFHDLRHTFATMAIENGIDIKTVAALLGHNTVATSINTYTHTTDEMRRAAASNIDRKIGGVEPLNNIRVSEQPSAENAPKAKFEAYKGKRRKPGTGYIKQLSPNCWQGRYTPTINGKRTSYNIYAPTEIECEEKLAELIKSIREEREQNIG